MNSRCQNGGICIDSHFSYICECDTMYTGLKCECEFNLTHQMEINMAINIYVDAVVWILGCQNPTFCNAGSVCKM